ncbi:MAG: hypothetical protein ACM34K_16075 [Bacillota bacterium]
MKSLSDLVGKSIEERGKKLSYDDIIAHTNRIGYFAEVKEIEVCLEVGDRTKWCDKDDFVKEVCQQILTGKTLTLAIHYAVFNLMGKEIVSRVS